MGDQQVASTLTNEARVEFIAHLLHDVQALELMLEKKLFETDITRIGAEQEFCLVNEYWRPSRASEEILEAIADPHFTTELARYNLEVNLDPLELKTTCFSQLEASIRSAMMKAANVAKKYNNKIVLAGILPTITKKELAMGYISPNPRYYALNTMMKQLRGSDFELHIKGVDELTIIHDSVLFEACNTSFQMHLQIKPDDFISSYNWAQAISGPVLGASTNSPLLLGRELWSETRIALFQQSIDIRSFSNALKDQQARVTFSNEWATGSIVDIYKNQIAQHKIILTKEIATTSIAELSKGIIPKLSALSLHNSTVYRWNRPCYGVGNGKPHLRIENRYIPAGPTIKDEIANFVFWVGLMVGRPNTFNDMSATMDFRDVKSNFIKAARNGKDTVLEWMGKPYTVKELINKELMPIAQAGLTKMNIDKEDIATYLKIIEERINKHTGATWTIKNYRKLKNEMRQDDALVSITKSMHAFQAQNLPVHEWPDLEPDEFLHPATLVGHIMTTKVFSVDENDLASLATSIMEWKNIHHVPVENHTGQLTGLLTWTHMKRHKQHTLGEGNSKVEEIMEKNIITAYPEMEIKKAITIMKAKEIGCLPVIQNRHLVGIITIEDVIEFDRGNRL